MRKQRGQALGLTFAIAALLTLMVLFVWPGSQRVRADNGTAIAVTTHCNSGGSYSASSAQTQIATVPATTVACHAQWPASAAYTAVSESLDWGDGSAATSGAALQGGSHSYSAAGTYTVVDTVTFCASKNDNSCAPLQGTAVRISVTGASGANQAPAAPNTQRAAATPNPLLCHDGSWAIPPQNCPGAAPPAPSTPLSN